jgi:hypothetical protein
MSPVLRIFRKRLRQYEILLRAVAGFLALIILGGFAWFPRTDLSTWDKFYYLSPALALALEAALPRWIVSMPLVKGALGALVVLGCFRTALDVIADAKFGEGPEYDVILFRIGVAFLMVVLIFRPFSALSATNNERSKNIE